VDKNTVGHIFDIQHFSIHDGPGIRCTVFLKGCNLRCLWCHNPESLLTRPLELSFVPSLCIGCGYCFKVCPSQCHRMDDGEHKLDLSKCVFCGQCAKECYSKALTTVGRNATAEEVIEEVMRDEMFYETSGGGITLSGGEPMLQREFLKTVLAMSKERGIHTALETNAVYNFALLDGVKENVDLFLVDFKATDPDAHKRLTGADNTLVLENLKKLHDEGLNVLIRCPIVLGQNDTQEHFKKIAELTCEYSNFMGAELLPYHRLGVSKINRFGLTDDVPHAEFDIPTRETEQHWIDTVRGFGGRLVNEDVI